MILTQEITFIVKFITNKIYKKCDDYYFYHERLSFSLFLEKMGLNTDEQILRNSSKYYSKNSVPLDFELHCG